MEMEMGKGKGYEYGGTGRWCESNEQMASGKKSVGRAAKAAEQKP
jgi:hypothetical protein